MKGEIFKFFENFLVEVWGKAAFEQIYQKAQTGLHTKEPYVGPGTYPDADFLHLFGTAVNNLGLDPRRALFAFGRACLPMLAQKLPNIKQRFPTPRDLILGVNDIIHVEVRKIYAQAETPHFEFREIHPDRILMVYHSKRNLSDFAEGLLVGVGDYYGERVQVFAGVAPDQEHAHTSFDVRFQSRG